MKNKTSGAVHDMSLLTMNKPMYELKKEEPMAVRPWEEILPEAWKIREDLSVEITLYYPNASDVYIEIVEGEKIILKKSGDFWVGNIQGKNGIIGVTVVVDGNEVLSPYLPIGFGGNRPVNYIDIPVKDFIITENDIPNGTVAVNYMNSSVTGRLERVAVYLPPDYFKNNEKHYPVLYLQHGHGENELVWLHQGKVNFIFDKLIAEKKAVEAIIVMCNGMYFEEKTDGVHLRVQRLEDMIVNEVIPFIDKKYRTIPQGKYRAIAGLSMGSMQTSIIGFKHSELFSYIGIFSGFIENFLTHENSHMEPEYFTEFKKNNRLCFRAIGDKDIFMEYFLLDDKLLEQNQISCVRNIYDGMHEWKVWRKCFMDFVQLLFRDENRGGVK